MKTLGQSENQQQAAPVDPNMIRALAGLDVDANTAVVQRTRRAVMAAANEMRAARSRSRRQIGTILLAVGVFAMLLTPAIWVFAEDILEGDFLQDSPTLVMSLVVTVLSTIFAALVLTWRNRESRSREGL